jgi:ribonuclease HI
MEPLSLRSRREELLEGVDPAWRPLLDVELLDGALGAVDAAGDGARTAPPPGLIFEALRYGAPADVTALVLGREPATAPGLAHGLSLSAAAPSEELEALFDGLARAGLRRGRGAAGAPAPGDLRPWAVQGVLMLNLALTARADADSVGSHAAAWEPFVVELLRRFCAGRDAGPDVHALVCAGRGALAPGCAGALRGLGPLVHEWPEWPEWPGWPGAPGHSCPFFGAVDAAARAAGRRAVVWDNLSPAIAFSDGACTANGRPGAQASFAALVTGGQFGAAVVRGRVRPVEYALVDEEDPARGIRATGTPAAPSNNRGELLGIIYAFLALLRGHAVGRVELVSDSKISVKTLLEWLPARLEKKTERELKNLDLVMIAWRLLAQLRGRAAHVALTHVRAHRKAPPATAPTRERFLHRGNALADEHAALALAAPDYAVEVLTAPPALKTLSS